MSQFSIDEDRSELNKFPVEIRDLIVRPWNDLPPEMFALYYDYERNHWNQGAPSYPVAIREHFNKWINAAIVAQNTTPDNRYQLYMVKTQEDGSMGLLFTEYGQKPVPDMSVPVIRINYSRQSREVKCAPLKAV